MAASEASAVPQQKKRHSRRRRKAAFGCSHDEASPPRLLLAPIPPVSRRSARGGTIRGGSRPPALPGLRIREHRPCVHNLAASLWPLPPISCAMLPMVASRKNQNKTRKIKNSSLHDSIRRVRICGEASDMGGTKEKTFCMARAIPPQRGSEHDAANFPG